MNFERNRFKKIKNGTIVKTIVGSLGTGGRKDKYIGKIGKVIDSYFETCSGIGSTNVGEKWYFYKIEFSGITCESYWNQSCIKFCSKTFNKINFKFLKDKQ